MTMLAKWDVKLGIISKPRDLWRELVSLIRSFFGGSWINHAEPTAHCSWMRVAWLMGDKKIEAQLLTNVREWETGQKDPATTGSLSAPFPFITSIRECTMGTQRLKFSSHIHKYMNLQLRPSSRPFRLTDRKLQRKETKTRRCRNNALDSFLPITQHGMTFSCYLYWHPLPIPCISGHSRPKCSR